MGNKVKLITPLLMLLGGAVASIVMFIKEYEFIRMLWTLLIVLIIFYIIGDIVRYIYAAIRPRIISQDVDYSDFIPLSRFDDESGKVRAYADNADTESDEFDASSFLASAAGADEGYSDEDLEGYGENNGEYSDDGEL